MTDLEKEMHKEYQSRLRTGRRVDDAIRAAAIVAERHIEQKLLQHDVSGKRLKCWWTGNHYLYCANCGATKESECKAEGASGAVDKTVSEGDRPQSLFEGLMDADLGRE